MTMRVAAALSLVLACATSGSSGPLHPADPALAAQDAPGEAIAEAAGVAVRVAIGGWRGQPRDLQQRLTPVDVTVANRLDRPIRIGPEAFELVPSHAAPLHVLTHEQVAQALRGLAGFRPRAAPAVGSVGGPTFPGYDSPIPYGGVPGPVPPPGQWYETQDVSATLRPGRETSLLLFFDTPATSLAAATVEIRIVDDAGKPVTTIRVPFARG